MKEKSSLNTIDVGKIFFSIIVVMIHTQPLVNASIEMPVGGGTSCSKNHL